MSILNVNPEMIGPVVRLHSIHMIDFRNIEDSTIVFPNSTFSDISESKPSILGLYGQNGSGKTTVVMALGLLKKLLSGESIDSKYGNCIRQGCKFATLEFVFSLKGTIKSTDRDNQELINLCTEGLDNSRCEVTYKLDITNTKRTTSGSETNVILIENEQFSLKILDSLNNVVMPKQVFVDTTESLCNFKMQSFGNKTKFKLLTGDDEEVQCEVHGEQPHEERDDEVDIGAVVIRDASRTDGEAARACCRESRRDRIKERHPAAQQ